MKKKRITLIILIMLLSVISITIIISKKNKKYIMQDGIMLALTLDGNGITTFPSGTKYRVNIECKNAKGIWLADEWSLSVEKITGNVTCNVDFYSNPTTLKSEVESVNPTNNNGYRYSGKQPDNWVWFNNEKWRIIGSIPVTLSDGTTSNLVKIIRSQTIGGLAFNSSDSNTTWGSNTLYDLLNNYYYGKKDKTGESPCLGYSSSGYTLCNYTEIGISNSATDYYGRMIKDVYWNVGTVSDTATVISTAYTLEAETKSTVTGKIGLMSASDYGYAASGITYSSKKVSSLNSYEQSNWLYGQSYEWLLTPYSTSRVMRVSNSGSVNYFYAYDMDVVRPVVYLDASVYIVSGDGTEGNPYQIGMPDKIVEIINFTIEDWGTYEAVSGMTFADWVNSEYNTDGWELNEDEDAVYMDDNVIWDGNDSVKSYDTIKPEYTYQTDNFWSSSN